MTHTGVSTAQLAALTRVSQNCEQFIKFECNNDIASIENSYVWLVSRDGTRMYYWGGATGYNNTYACGVTNSCSDGKHEKASLMIIRLTHLITLKAFQLKFYRRFVLKQR